MCNTVESTNFLQIFGVLHYVRFFVKVKKQKSLLFVRI